MKIKIDDIKNFQSVTKTVARGIAGRNTTLPVLTCFKLDASTDKNQIRLTASNGEMFISQRMDAEVTEKGSCLIPAKIFEEAMSKFSSSLNIEQEKNLLKITCDSSEMKFTVQEPSSFPKQFAIDEEGIDFTIGREVFLDAVYKTIFAASQDLTKGAITGVLFEIDKGHLVTVGVDGYRMAVCDTPIENEVVKKVIISAKNLAEIQRIVSKAKTETIQMKMDEKSVRFEIDDIKIIVSILADDFVDYKGILPKEHNTSIVVNKDDFFRAIDRTTLITVEDRHNFVRLSIKDNHIDIESTSQEGSVSEYVAAKVTGEELEIGFNAKYLMDALKRVEDDDVEIEFNTAVRPALIKSSNQGYEQIVLPVRLSH